MRIPFVGMQVLYVVKAADQAAGTPVQMRPAVVTNVVSYSTEAAIVNLSVMFDGPADAKYFSGNLEGQTAWVAEVCYSEKQEEGTFCVLPKPVTPKNISYYWRWECIEIKVAYEITHGRERIKEGAVGIWDQYTDTVTFKREDVVGIGADQPPVYPAFDFFAWHIARIAPIPGYETRLREIPSDGSETPEEHAAMVRMIADEMGLHADDVLPPVPSSILEAMRRKQKRMRDERQQQEKEIKAGEHRELMDLKEPNSKDTLGGGAETRPGEKSGRRQMASSSGEVIGG